ncbi:MAG TPA: YfdX family protein [Gammaproteobacteria bacterium]|nr:YfdX family protein [Gammaproteobacteria bacterium]
MNINRKISAAILPLLAGIMLSATNSMATTPAAATNTRQAQIQRASMLEKNGRRAMTYIVAAQQLLSEQHREEAQQYLKKARKLLNTLNSDKLNKAGLLSIYSQLGVKKKTGLTRQLKQKLEKTHLDVISGKHKKVITALKKTGVELRYSFVDLPVAATLAKVESALKYLSEKNVQQARKTLADAEAGLIRNHIIINPSAAHKHIIQHPEHSQGVI